MSHFLDRLLVDLRAAIRGVLRDPAFSLTAVATLSIALALNVTVFTIRDAMLFRGLPLADRSDRLVYLAMRRPADPACCPGPVAYADLESWRSQARSYEGFAIGRSPGGQRVGFRDEKGRPLDTMVWRYSANTFSLLGVRPSLGRDFTTADEQPGALPVAIVSHRFWQARFDARADAVGSIVHINNVPTTVVGVMPERFTIVSEQDLWLPMSLSAEAVSDVAVIARLRDDTTIEQARAELSAISGPLHASDPPETRPVPLVRTYSQAHVAPDAPVIYGTLWAGAWFVVLIACANLANLTLVRTVGRWREFATRLALGASASRLVRQMVIESLVISATAAPIAWWITQWAVTTWSERTFSPYLALDFSITGGTLAYLSATAVVAAVLIPLPSIAKLLTSRGGGMLKGEARGVTQGARTRRMTTALVASQMSLAIVLLLGCGVLLRSFVNIVGADPGIRGEERVVTGLVGLPSAKYQTADARMTFFDRLQTQLRSISGVEHVSVANTVPIRGVPPRRVEVEGRDVGEPIQVMTAGDDYFEVMGRSGISGRDFNTNDTTSAPLVAIVNQSFAAAYGQGGSPSGIRLRIVDDGPLGRSRTVIGVAPNVMQGDPLRRQFKPVVYLPFRQLPTARAFVYVRSTHAADSMIQTVLAEIRRLDADAVTEQFSGLKAKLAFDRDWMDLEHADLGKHAVIAPVFAVIALVLASIGLIAVIAHSISQRTKEIGIRIAVGAAARDIAAMVLREGMRPVAIGLVVGLVVAAGSNRLLQSQLVGISPYDPLTIIGGPIILIAAAVIGCRIPARRAMQVDPVIALRHD